MTGFNLSENAKSEPVRVRDDKKNRTTTIMDINHPAFLFCGAQNREIKKEGEK
jgi:hypothetical protein